MLTIFIRISQSIRSGDSCFIYEIELFLATIQAADD
jgi:hypothetical protein